MTRRILFHAGGYVALALILTAGAAQSLAGSNTVTGDDIVDGTIGTVDLHDRTVTGPKVLNNSLTGSDIVESSLTIPGRIVTIEPTFSSTFTLNPGARDLKFQACPSGLRALSGGLYSDAPANLVLRRHTRLGPGWSGSSASRTPIKIRGGSRCSQCARVSADVRGRMSWPVSRKGRLPGWAFSG